MECVMKQFLIVSALASFLICAPAYSQPVCLTLPSASPVLSSSPDAIPATAEDIVTYTGAYAKARANHNFSFVQISANEQKVWFGVDANPSLNKAFYNRRYRADS